MAVCRFKATLKDSFTNEKFYGKVNQVDVVETTFVTDYDKRVGLLPANFSGTINLRHDINLEITCDSPSFDETGENTYSVFFQRNGNVYELWAGISGRKVVNFGLNEWLSYGDYEDGSDADYVYHDTDFTTFNWEYLPLSNSELKKLVALTDVQRQLVKEFGNLINEMEEKGVKLVYDSSNYSYAAVNMNNLSVLSSEEEDLNDDSVNLEQAIEWNNVPNIGGIYEYSSYCYELCGNVK